MLCKSVCEGFVYHHVSLAEWCKLISQMLIINPRFNVSFAKTSSHRNTIPALTWHVSMHIIYKTTSRITVNQHMLWHIIVIVPFWNITDNQLQSNDFGVKSCFPKETTVCCWKTFLQTNFKSFFRDFLRTGQAAKTAVYFVRIYLSQPPTLVSSHSYFKIIETPDFASTEQVLSAESINLMEEFYMKMVFISILHFTKW